MVKTRLTRAEIQAAVKSISADCRRAGLVEFCVDRAEAQAVASGLRTPEEIVARKLRLVSEARARRAAWEAEQDALDAKA